MVLVRWTAGLFLAACGPGPTADVVVPPLEVADPQVLTFVAIGDAGKSNETQRRVASAARGVCAERGCDAVVLLGDNLYPRGMDGPHDPRMAEATTEMYGTEPPLLMVLGNHDYGHGQDHQAAAWQVAWANATDGVVLPAPTWRMQAGPAELFVLDTTDVFWRGHRSQARWLARALDGSEARWRVVLGHHPYRSNGDHGNAGTYEGLPLPWVGGRGLRTLFDEELCGRVDLYLAGHDHNLQWLQHCDLDLVVSGAGASARPIVDRGNEPRFARAVPGFAWVRLDTAITVSFFDETGTLLHEGKSTAKPVQPREHARR